MDPLDVGATWLHAAAMVLVLGYYAVLARIVIPALRRSLVGGRLGETLGETVVSIERRALPLIVGAVIVFTATGAWLMINDTRYAGLGDVTASTWTMLILVKHLVVVVMVALGVALDIVIGSSARFAEDGGTDARWLRRVQWLADGIWILGAAVLLMTAAAQVSA
jgi:hypothetical protein